MNDSPQQGLQALVTARRKRHIVAIVALAGLWLLLALLSLGVGAAGIGPKRVVDVLIGVLRNETEIVQSRDALVVMNIRLPRMLLAMLVGAALAVSGALLQGLFRNPLADPGLVGVSAGSGLAVAATIVLGERVFSRVPSFVLLPFGAFAGGLVSTMLLYAVATRQGRTSISTMLLAGVALGALAFALTGLLATLADDRQLRDFTFWTLGSLGGATWTKTTILAPIILPLLFAVPFLARGLNALALGEAEAFHLGLPVQRIKILAIISVALMVGSSVAATGLISFVGIVVPHLLRLVVGPDHKRLLPLSALLGASLLVGADMLARILVAPAELPIGILTALIGAPFFLWMLLRRDGSVA